MSNDVEPPAEVTAALITGKGEVTFQSFPAEKPGPGLVTVGIHLCGICGTDLASYRHGHLHSPAVCGHEWVGLITGLGPDVTLLTEGERVVIAVRPPCGSCPECQSGLSEHCRVALAMARGRDPHAPPHGGFAPSLTVEASRVMPAHPELSDQEAAMVEPATVAFHGVRRSQIALGDIVVVQGGGPIGLLALQFARAAGAGHVCLVEPLAERRLIGEKLGADSAFANGDEAGEFIRSITHGIGADLVLECAGLPSLIQSAVEKVRPGGSVTILSYIRQSATIEPARWLSKEVTVRGAVAYTHDDFRRTMNLIADGRINVTMLHTSTVGLHQIEDALNQLARGDSDQVKILVDPRVRSIP